MSLSKRLADIRKIIKQEANDDFSINDNSRPENTRHFPDFQLNSPVNNEPLREQFLNKTLTANDVISSLTGRVDTRNIRNESNQLAGIYNRAEDVNRRLRGDLNNSRFYANVPENIKDPIMISSRHESPLVLNNNNAMYNIQATSENVNNVINSNPYREIPYSVQSTGTIIGANLQMIKKAIIEENQKRKIPPAPSVSDSASKYRRVDSQILHDATQVASTSMNISTTYQETHRTMVDRSVATTKNTGCLQFEITSTELENLSEEKKVILLEFMKAFNIRDNREIKSIRERLRHRLANQQNKRKSSYTSYASTYGPPI